MKTSKQTTLVLSGGDVNEIVENFGLHSLMDRLILKLTTAVLGYDETSMEIPIRSGFNYNNDKPGLVEFMPVHALGEGIVLKVVGYHPRNPDDYGLPTILSSITSYDIKTGHLQGIADGVLLTALRTGAASAVASKFMAQPDSGVLGLIGCGAQAITQLHAISRCYPLEQVYIYDVDETVVSSFAERCAMLDLHVEIIPSSISEIMSKSDIVCTATSIDVGLGPLFETYETKDHLHINAIGSDFPGKIELPLSLLRKSTVVPDFREQAKLEGECQQLNDEEIGPDLVTLVKNHTDFDHIANTLTVFDSTGWALEDRVVMKVFMDLAEEFNIGMEVSIENTSEDAKNPYHFMLKTVKA
ncbi:MAG: ornithine cyclodeaminase family protein [Bacteroidota bacterium]